MDKKFGRHAAGLRWLAVLAWLGFEITAAVAANNEANRDYYAPRIEQEEVRVFNQVRQYHLKPGIESMQKANFAGALEHFEFILNYYPNDPQLLNLISELCALKWRSPKCNADVWFERGLARNPEASMTYVVYGIHAQRRGRPDLAVQILNKAVAMQPDSINAHYNLGLAYFEVKDYVQANRHAQESYALGAQLPGLRDKLIKVGKWNPLPAEEKARVTNVPDVPTSTQRP